MKIEKSELAEKLKKLKGLLVSKVNEQAGVLLRGNSIYASNYEMCAKTKLNIENTNEKFIIPKKVVDLIEKLPNETIEITTTDKSIVVRCESIRNRYQAIPTDTYFLPEMAYENDNSIAIDSEAVCTALRSVLYAVNDEFQQKEFLKGVFLGAHNGTLNIVGCDGYRLSWNKVDYDGEFEVIIPKSAVQRLLDIGIIGDISLIWNDRNIIFKSDEYELVSRTLCGEYLNYEKLFPKYSGSAVIDRKAAIECIKRALICADKNTSPNVLRFNFRAGELKVSTNSSISEYEETLRLNKAASEEIGELEIGFNGRYLLEAFGSFEEDKLSLELGGATQPMIISGKNQKALLLPVRLENES